MQLAIDRIMEGGLHARLPVGRGGDEMARLAGSVNRMLERLERLLDEIKGVGDDIAHDLRTPLSRVRAGLERAVLHPVPEQGLRAAINRAVADLDQCFAVITALLRIGEIEHGRRQEAFAAVGLRELAAEVVELYEPLAEAAGNRLLLDPGPAASLRGDRDLLVELLANLVDNAIKFTPAGGSIRVAVLLRDGTPVLRVADTGIGIAASERDAVLGRFYRSDKSRHVGGSGLGLSLCNAIARLHGARVVVGGVEGGGAVFEILFPII